MQKATLKDKNSHYMRNGLVDIKDTLADATQDVRDTVEEIFSRSVGNAKKKSTMVKDNVASYIGEKPYKSVLIATLAGICVGYLTGRK